MNKKYFKMSYTTLFVGAGLVNASQIDNTDNTHFNGVGQFNAYNNPKKACDLFNKKVKKINAVLSKTEGAGYIGNLCQSIRFTDAQIEDTYYLTTVNGAYQHGSREFPVTEKINVTRTIDLLMFSQSNKTDYVVIVDGSADVLWQAISYVGKSVNWAYENVSPFFYWYEGYIGQVFHRNSQFNYIAGEAAYNLANQKAKLETTNHNEITHLTWKYLAERCGDHTMNKTCIPQGEYFGDQLIGTETYPSSTNKDGTTVNIANSTSFSFNITGNFELAKSNGPSAGLVVGFGFEKTQTTDQAHSVMTLTSAARGNDIGTAVTQKINTLALGKASYYAQVDDWNHVVNAASIWGESLYRSFPLKAYEAWQEHYTDSPNSCRSQNLIFGNSLKIGRTHLNMYGSSWNIRDEDTKFIDSYYGLVVQTECVTDQKGQTFRVMKETLL
jgi:hypothetical protein